MAHRRIRTFHARHGRITESRQRDLDELVPRYSVPDDGPIGPAPLVLEVGAGHGEAAYGFATTHPDVHLVAVDVHRPGIVQLVRRIDTESVRNVSVHIGDAVDLLDDRITTGELAGLHLFFPDPWPKRAQTKRRFVRAELLDLVADRMAAEATFLTATDEPGYAEQMQAEFERHPEFEIVSTDRPDWRPATLYERKATRPIAEFTARRRSPGNRAQDSR